MPVNKIFKRNKKNWITSFTEINSNEIYTYYFSIVWSAPAIINLYSLVGQVHPNGIWHNIITKGITDNDGEITVKIGEFNKGTVLNFVAGVFAITNTERVAIVITNATTGESKK
jgi:hypothetical protein